MVCRWLFLLLALFLIGCGQGIQSPLDTPCDIREGELLLSEWHVDSEQPDLQWLELKNTSSRSLSLHRLLLSLEGRTEPIILQGTQQVPAGKVVLVVTRESSLSGDYHVDTLPLHRATGLSMSCDGANFFSWQVPDLPLAAADSIIVSPFVFEDTSNYHDANAWCAASSVGEATPGTDNPACGTLRCLDDNEQWVKVPPAIAGSVRLNEIMANPSGEDGNNEWFELLSMHSRPVLLNGLHISTNDQQWRLMSSRCMWLQPAEYTVVGVQSDVSRLRTIAADYWLAGDALANKAVTFQLALRGMAQSTFVAASEFSSGISQGVDGLNVTELTPSGGVCAAQSGLITWDGSEYATPGQLNDACEAACLDSNYRWRRLPTAVEGELLISEVFANPDGADQGREWLEIYVNSTTPRLANGLEIKQKNSLTGNERRWTFEAKQCVPLAAQSYAVIAADASLPGLGKQAISIPQLQLYNDVSEISLLRAGQQIDNALLPVAINNVSSGVSFEQYQVSENDRTEQFCSARRESAWGKSSPGTANDPCGEVCWRQGTWQPLRKLMPADLQITEILTNPEGADNGRDWLQLRLTTSEARDLNDASVVHRLLTGSERRWQLLSADCLEALPGKPLILSGDGNDLAALNINAMTISGLDMYSSEVGTLQLWQGSVSIDSAHAAKGVSGVAQRLISPQADNDLGTSWCAVPDKMPALLNGAANADSSGC
ncbi:MAG: hypothetical protein OEW58_09660 [Gammaproteobacteria bacterium]|nr:hypothetical protein [Gammaproteobacteria bacterium]